MATLSNGFRVARRGLFWITVASLALASAWLPSVLTPKDIAMALVGVAFVAALVADLDYGLAFFLVLICIMPSRFNKEYLDLGTLFLNVYDPFLVALLVAWILRILAGKETLQSSGHVAWVFALMAVILLSADAAAGEYRSPLKMLAGISDWIHLFLFYLFAYHVIGNSRRPQLLFYALMVGSVIVALYGIYSYFYVKSDYAFPGTAVRAFSFEKRNVVGSMIGGGATTLGGFLALTAPLVFVTMLTTRNWLLKMVLLGGFASQVFMSVLTFSRGGWLGLSGALGLTIMLVTKRPLRLVLGVILFVGLLLAGWKYLPVEVHKRFATTFQPRNEVNIERLTLWEKGRSYFRRSPLLGTGPNNKFNTSIPYCMAKKNYIFHCHNWALYTLAEFGICGAALLFGYLLVVMGRTFWRLIAARQEIPPGYYGAFCGLLGFMFHNQVDYFLWQPRVNFVFWTMILLLVHMNPVEQEAAHEYRVVRAHQPV